MQSLQFRHTTHSGRTFANTPVASKFYPALIFSKLGRPPVLFAFLGGVLAGGLIPDRVEEYWVELILEPLFANR